MSEACMTQPAASFRFSTDDVPQLRRPDTVNSLRERGILPIGALPGHDVHVDVVKWTVPDIQILFGTLAGVRQDCLSCHAVGELLLGIGVRGEAGVLHGGHELTVRRGDAFAVAANRSSFTVVRPLRTQFIGLRIPETVLASRVAHIRKVSNGYHVPHQRSCWRHMCARSSAGAR
jgi:hypothetical protein